MFQYLFNRTWYSLCGVKGAFVAIFCTLLNLYVVHLGPRDVERMFRLFLFVSFILVSDNVKLATVRYWPNLINTSVKDTLLV